jgi:hypothetical protein
MAFSNANTQQIKSSIFKGRKGTFLSMKDQMFTLINTKQKNQTSHKRVWLGFLQRWIKK